MGAAKTLLSAEEFDHYPFEEDKRYELDEGELIETTRPAYRHNRVLVRLTARLFVFFETYPIGEVSNSENLFALSPSTRRAPDAAIILGDRRNQLEGAKVIPVIPDIAVEVLSPSETTAKIVRKLKQYFEAGVKETWLIYPEINDVELWRGPHLADRTLTAGDVLTSDLLPEFALPLSDLFS
jgi:Uma2 family endonuclease